MSDKKLGMSDEQPNVDDRAVWDIWLSTYRMPSLAAADTLGVFEALNDKPANADELGARLGVNVEPLKALLPMLTALDLLVVRLGRYQLTQPARVYVLKDSPFYWGHTYLGARDGEISRLLLNRFGVAARNAQDSKPSDAWESGQVSKELSERIAPFMNSHSLAASLGVARAGGFGGVRRLLDVGGGSGCFSIALARRHAAMHCTIMELPTMCERAQEYIAAAGLSARVDTNATDMFREAWPKGYDAILMGNILHDWDPDTNAKIAASAFAALPSGGRIFLHEMLIDDDGSGPLAAASFSVVMLVGTKGRQYSLGEFKQLLEGAGFTDVAAIDSYGYYSLVSARKP